MDLWLNMKDKTLKQLKGRSGEKYFLVSNKEGSFKK